VGTARLVWWVLIGVLIWMIMGVTSFAYIETLYLRAQLRQEMKELRKLKRELKEEKEK